MTLPWGTPPEDYFMLDGGVKMLLSTDMAARAIRAGLTKRWWTDGMDDGSESGLSMRVAGGKTTDCLPAAYYTHRQATVPDQSSGTSCKQTFRFSTFSLHFITHMCWVSVCVWQQSMQGGSKNRNPPEFVKSRVFYRPTVAATCLNQQLQPPTLWGRCTWTVD